MKFRKSEKKHHFFKQKTSKKALELQNFEKVVLLGVKKFNPWPLSCTEKNVISGFRYYQILEPIERLSTVGFKYGIS